MAGGLLGADSLFWTTRTSLPPTETPSGLRGPCHLPREGKPGSHLLSELSVQSQFLLGFLLGVGREKGG